MPPKLEDMEIVQYKGRNYRLAWTGETKWGKKCKLLFMNGEGEFWALAEEVSIPRMSRQPSQEAQNPRAVPGFEVARDIVSRGDGIASASFVNGAAQAAQMALMIGLLRAMNDRLTRIEEMLDVKLSDEAV